MSQKTPPASGGEKLIECVPNVSEGRDERVIQELAEAVQAIPGVWLLDVDPDPDHHRTVITFAGPPEAVVEAAIRLARLAVERIDLNRHRGQHPRIGALDVLPFVPLENATLEECVQLAVRAGERLWEELGVPVYLYGAAARRPERKTLAPIRRGQFEQLRLEALRDPKRAPDIGGPGLHPTAGATAVGARAFLIAFNVQLENADLQAAQEIARVIRGSSGGLPGVQAMGVWLESRQQAQVSMNITDIEAAPLALVHRRVTEEARKRGARVASSEIVGLIPRRALELSRGYDLQLENFTPDKILEVRLERARAAQQSLRA